MEPVFLREVDLLQQSVRVSVEVEVVKFARINSSLLGSFADQGHCDNRLANVRLAVDGGQLSRKCHLSQYMVLLDGSALDLLASACQAKSVEVPSS